MVAEILQHSYGHIDGKDAHQDQAALLAVLLGHSALLVDGAFLLVACPGRKMPSMHESAD